MRCDVGRPPWVRHGPPPDIRHPAATLRSTSRASHHVHAQHVLVRLPHAALDGGQAQALVCLHVQGRAAPCVWKWGGGGLGQRRIPHIIASSSSKRMRAPAGKYAEAHPPAWPNRKPCFAGRRTCVPHVRAPCSRQAGLRTSEPSYAPTHTS